MLTGRGDIIGDLARLRNEFAQTAKNADELLGRLEVLAAVAVQLGMSHKIVGKASDIPRERIDAVFDTRPYRVDRRATDYQLSKAGVVHLRDRPTN